MPVVATLLFGSIARAEPSLGSDTDLLLINHDGVTRHVSVGQLSVFLYPWGTLEQYARDGDLFVCHLVREAKPIFDPDGYLPRLEEVFRFRPDYTAEIARATDFGWFLARYGEELNSRLLAKRTLWCIRTILIARSAEQRQPVFASRLLAKQTGSVAGRELLIRRHSARDDAELRRLLRRFLEEEATPRPLRPASGPERLHRSVSGNVECGCLADAAARRAESSWVLRSVSSYGHRGVRDGWLAESWFQNYVTPSLHSHAWPPLRAKGRGCSRFGRLTIGGFARRGRRLNLPDRMEPHREAGVPEPLSQVDDTSELSPVSRGDPPYCADGVSIHGSKLPY